jgi:hypothetical protein
MMGLPVRVMATSDTHRRWTTVKDGLVICRVDRTAAGNEAILLVDEWLQEELLPVQLASMPRRRQVVNLQLTGKWT